MAAPHVTAGPNRRKTKMTLIPGKKAGLFRGRRTLVASAAIAALTISAANAETLRWARVGDALTLDPHSANEGPTSTILHHIYETLVERATDGSLEPRLATEWSIHPDDPMIWIFTLREGVTFHDGAEFTAEDVVTSLERVRAESSDFKGLHTAVESAEAVDALCAESHQLLHHGQGLDRGERRRDTAGFQGWRGEVHRPKHERDRAIHARVARYRSAHGPRLQREPLGRGAGGDRDRLHPDQGSRDPRRRPAVGRSGFRAGRARAGHRPARSDRRHHGDGRSREPDDLFLLRHVFG